MDEAVLDEKSSFKKLELSFFSKLDWVPYMVLVAKTATKNIES